MIVREDLTAGTRVKLKDDIIGVKQRGQIVTVLCFSKSHKHFMISVGEGLVKDIVEMEIEWIEKIINPIHIERALIIEFECLEYRYDDIKVISDLRNLKRNVRALIKEKVTIGACPKENLLHFDKYLGDFNLMDLEEIDNFYYVFHDYIGNEIYRISIIKPDIMMDIMEYD